MVGVKNCSPIKPEMPMIDLHSHILPGLDDGSPNLAVSLEMARLAVADGITHMACTPHILPGMYGNGTRNIAAAVQRLEHELRHVGIPLALFVGADIHVVPDLAAQLLSGKIPTLNGSRYFLFEPPHHILPPRLEDLAIRVINTGFTPILTHPERLSWIESNYNVIERLNVAGCLIQLTADSILGAFGHTALYYSEKLIDEGRVDIVASDAHSATRRRPGLSQAAAAVAKRCGDEEANNMVLKRPRDILNNVPLVPAGKMCPSAPPASNPGRFGGLGRFFKVGT